MCFSNSSSSAKTTLVYFNVDFRLLDAGLLGRPELGGPGPSRIYPVAFSLFLAEALAKAGRVGPTRISSAVLAPPANDEEMEGAINPRNEIHMSMQLRPADAPNPKATDEQTAIGGMKRTARSVAKVPGMALKGRLVGLHLDRFLISHPQVENKIIEAVETHSSNPCPLSDAELEEGRTAIGAVVGRAPTVPDDTALDRGTRSLVRVLAGIRWPSGF